MTSASTYASKAPSRRKEKTILGWLTSGAKGGATEDFQISLGQALKLGNPRAFEDFATERETPRSVKVVGLVVYHQHSAAIRPVRIVAAEHRGDWKLSYACAWEMLNLCGFVEESVKVEVPVPEPIQVEVPVPVPAPMQDEAVPVPAPIEEPRRGVRRVRAREGPAEDDMIANPQLQMSWCARPRTHPEDDMKVVSSVVPLIQHNNEGVPQAGSKTYIFSI